jgi:hypothetical protein
MHSTSKIGSFMTLRANGWSLDKIRSTSTSSWSWDVKHQNEVHLPKHMQLGRVLSNMCLAASGSTNGKPHLNGHSNGKPYLDRSNGNGHGAGQNQSSPCPSVPLWFPRFPKLTKTDRKPPGSRFRPF